jgi:hypothetical protein
MGVIASGQIGTDGQDQVAFWRSRDGLRWTMVAPDPDAFGPPGANVGVNDVIEGPRGYVAVGFDGLDGALDAAVWTSKNGTAWSQAPAAGALAAAVSSESAFVMFDVAYARKTYVAVGLARSLDDSGRLQEEPAIWTSRDARRWTRRTTGVATPAGFRPDSAGRTQVRLTLSVATDGGFAASGNQQHSERSYTMGGFALSSKDGVRWRPARADGRVFAFPPTPTTETAVRYEGAASGGGGVITGILRRPGDRPATAKIWLSGDGSSWKALRGKLVDGYVEGPAAGTDDGVLVLGYPHGSDGARTIAWIGGRL